MSEHTDKPPPPEPRPKAPMPNATVTPIRPAARPTNARTDAPSESTRRCWAHMQRTAQAIDAAMASGHAAGVHSGYRQGWRWGMASGLVAGALLASIGWAVWLTATAPDAAPARAVQQPSPPT